VDRAIRTDNFVLLEIKINLSKSANLLLIACPEFRSAEYRHLDVHFDRLMSVICLISISQLFVRARTRQAESILRHGRSDRSAVILKQELIVHEIK